MTPAASSRSVPVMLARLPWSAGTSPNSTAENNDTPAVAASTRASSGTERFSGKSKGGRIRSRSRTASAPMPAPAAPDVGA